MKKLLRLWLGLLMLLAFTVPAMAQTVPPLNLPADEKPHASLIEWYYYTGKVQTLGDESKTYGVEAVARRPEESQRPPGDVGGPAQHVDQPAG